MRRLLKQIATIEYGRLHLFKLLRFAHIELGCNWIHNRPKFWHVALLYADGELGWYTANHYLDLAVLGFTCTLRVYTPTKRSNELAEKLNDGKDYAVAHPESLSRVIFPEKRGNRHWVFSFIQNWDVVIFFWRRWNWQHFTLVDLSCNRSDSTGWEFDVCLLGLGLNGFEYDEALDGIRFEKQGAAPTAPGEDAAAKGER